MTKIKFCGLTQCGDIEAANCLKPDYIGFVFAKKSRRYISPEKAVELKRILAPGIQVVGVFAEEAPEVVAELLNSGTVDLAQLHGNEDEAYIRTLRNLTARPIIQAFRVDSKENVTAAGKSTADYILLDSGAGTGKRFDWELLQSFQRPYFLAGGLDCENAGAAVQRLHPFALDVSSGIEAGGAKNKEKMAAFMAAVRKEERI